MPWRSLDLGRRESFDSHVTTLSSHPVLDIADPEHSPPARLGRVPFILGILAAATVLGLVESSQVQYDRALQGSPITWTHALIHGLPRWYAWAVMVPAIVAVSGLIARRGWRPPAVLGVHALLAPAVVTIQVFVFSTVSTALHRGPGLVDHLKPAFLKYVGLTFLSGLIIYAVIVLGWHGWRVYGDSLRKEREASRLETRTAGLKALLAEAELSNLQNQLQPHFLFNALHTLNGLIRTGDSQRAAEMTQRIASFLRETLELSGRPEIDLRRELQLLDHYLEIQRYRFGSRLSASVTVDQSVLDARVPTLLLQPIVENAIRHGLEKKADAGCIDLRAYEKSGMLTIRILDDGPGPTDGEIGIGLSNCRARLAELYGSAASLVLAHGTERGGAEVTLRLPMSTTPPSIAACASAETGP